MRDRQAILDALLRRHFAFFLRKVFETVASGDVLNWNWHLDAIAWQLERVQGGELNRLIVTIPPRHLKSITISVAWVAFMLGHRPDLRVVCVSYSQELAQKHARDCRVVMSAEWYRRVFPGTVLSRSRNAEHDFETTARGGRFSTSVGGTLTGRGGDIIIIDDPMKPDDALSETVRTGVLEWYSTTLISRLNDKTSGAIILVMQRLHEDDLAGHLLETGSWEHLSLPAIAETDQVAPTGPDRLFRRTAGEPLHPDREPLALLEETRRTVGSMVFSAQYQQAPVPAEGNLVERRWLRRYQSRPAQRPGVRVVQSWDTATKDGVMNDWSVCLTALVRGREVYLVDVFRDRLSFPALRKKVVAQARHHGASVLLIEDAASGAQLIQQLRADSPSGVPRPIARRPEGDKLTRMAAQTSRIEAGELLLPEEAPWLGLFERELLAFPAGRHDDQVDALSQLLAWTWKRPPRVAAGPVATFG